MKVLLIFTWIYAAFIAMAFWEAYAEGRNAWHKGKLGWKIKLGKYYFSAYHFYLFVAMMPLLLSLPLIVYGWNSELFGILVSAYFSGLVLEDFIWFIVNPSVKLKEFYSSFSDYYPWIKVSRKKIIPLSYVLGIAIAILSWILLWR